MLAGYIAAGSIAEACLAASDIIHQAWFGMNQVVICSSCGELHSVEDVEFTLKRPDAIARLSETERAARCKETRDLSALWGEADQDHRYFVRGILPLRVEERTDTYNLGVWAEVPKASFDKVLELWDDPDQSAEPPFYGFLANEIPFRDGSLGLEMVVQLTGPTSRPSFKITNSAHGLHRDQSEGITPHQAHAYTKLVL